MVLINRNKINLENPITKNWRKLSPNEQKQFMKDVEQKGKDYAECGDYPYLLKGKESDGNDLYFSVRKNEYDQIEIKAEH